MNTQSPINHETILITELYNNHLIILTTIRFRKPKNHAEKECLISDDTNTEQSWVKSCKKVAPKIDGNGWTEYEIFENISDSEKCYTNRIATMKNRRKKTTTLIAQSRICSSRSRTGTDHIPGYLKENGNSREGRSVNREIEDIQKEEEANCLKLHLIEKERIERLAEESEILAIVTDRSVTSGIISPQKYAQSLRERTFSPRKSVHTNNSYCQEALKSTATNAEWSTLFEMDINTSENSVERINRNNNSVCGNNSKNEYGEIKGKGRDSGSEKGGDGDDRENVRYGESYEKQTNSKFDKYRFSCTQKEKLLTKMKSSMNTKITEKFSDKEIENKNDSNDVDKVGKMYSNNNDSDNQCKNDKLRKNIIYTEYGLVPTPPANPVPFSSIESFSPPYLRKLDDNYNFNFSKNHSLSAPFMSKVDTIQKEFQNNVNSSISVIPSISNITNISDDNDLSSIHRDLLFVDNDSNKKNHTINTITKNKIANNTALSDNSTSNLISIPISNTALDKYDTTYKTVSINNRSNNGKFYESPLRKNSPIDDRKNTGNRNKRIFHSPMRISGREIISISRPLTAASR